MENENNKENFEISDKTDDCNMQDSAEQNIEPLASYENESYDNFSEAEFVPVFEEDLHIYEYPVEEKKSGINKSLIAALSILLVFAVGFFGYLTFFNPTPQKAIKRSGIAGSWLYRNGDTATYYDFSEDGSLSVISGTVKSITDFEIDTEKKNTLLVYASRNHNTATQSSAIEYELFKDSDGIQSLRIFSSEDGTGEMIMQKSEVPTNILKPKKDFKAEKSMLGVWENKENGLKISLSEDGYISVDFGAVVYDGVYTVGKGEIEFDYSYNFDGSDLMSDKFYFKNNDGKSFDFCTSEDDDGGISYKFEKVSDNTK